ncbi:MAG: pilus assembly protein [Acidobacteriaceae bacterium]|nr:pilus assembly protein [Acidobacteriaceae bacterium]
MNVKAKFYRGRKKRERGSTLVEFTLTILPLLGLLMLTLDLAWVLFAWASIHEGVREGVRYAITMQSDDSIRAVVEQYSFGFVNDTSKNGPIQISYFAPDNTPKDPNDPHGNSPSNIVKIVVSGVSINPMAPIWRSASPILLTASSADIVEPNPNGSPRF